MLKISVEDQYDIKLLSKPLDGVKAQANQFSKSKLSDKGQNRKYQILHVQEKHDLSTQTYRSISQNETV